MTILRFFSGEREMLSFYEIIVIKEYPKNGKENNSNYYINLKANY